MNFELVRKTTHIFDKTEIPFLSVGAKQTIHLLRPAKTGQSRQNLLCPTKNVPPKKVLVIFKSLSRSE